MIKELEFDGHVQLSSLEDIRLFETEFGSDLPDTFVQFCLKYNGGGLAPSNTAFSVSRRFAAFWNEYGGDNPIALVGLDCLCGVLPISSPYSVRRVLDELQVNEQRTGFVLGSDPLPALNKTLSSSGAVLPIGYDLLGNYVLGICRSDGACQLDFWDHELYQGFAICDNLEEFYNGLQPE